MSPHFSVIIPTYNRSEYLVQAVRSILAQDYGNFEVIVVDDGGRDDSRQRLDDLDDPRIRYFWKENGERGAARNFGLSKAQGEFSAFLDSDDFWPPSHLSILKSFIERCGPFSLVAVDHVWFDETSLRTASDIRGQDRTWSLDEALWGNPFACNFVIHTESSSLRFVEDRDCSLGEDWVFFVEGTLRGLVAHTSATKVWQRRHDGQSMQENLRAVKARRACTDHMLGNFGLSVSQKRLLCAGSHRFCSIHLYLAQQRRLAAVEAVRALSQGLSVGQFVLIFLKALLGQRRVNRVKSLLHRVRLV